MELPLLSVEQAALLQVEDTSSWYKVDSWAGPSFPEFLICTSTFFLVCAVMDMCTITFRCSLNIILIESI